MINEIVIDSIGQYIDTIFSLQLDVNYIFRGQKDKNYLLNSSLKRSATANWHYVEKRMLENFKKYCLRMEPSISESIWKNMIIAQHHGIPTRLLDFTSSPLVALHFALTGNELDTDAVIWSIDINEIHTNLLPSKYKDILRKYESYSFTIDMLAELAITIEEYNEDMGSKSILFIEPPSIDDRIVGQASLLALIPDQLDPLDDFIEKNTVAYKFIIPYTKVRIFRKQLDCMNISERTMITGLDGVAAYLKRRYCEN